MGEYSKQGSYAGYDKDHLDRADLDYYATPPEEVENILEIEGLMEYQGRHFWFYEPCVGGGHMLKGIINYINKNDIPSHFIVSDLVDRGARNYIESIYVVPPTIEYHYDIGLLDGNGELPVADFVIMNPPFKDIDKFVNAVLPCATHKLIMLARLKFIESQKRYEQIFSKNPPTRVYQYIDRIACYKDGDFTIKPNSIEAYAWFVWDKDEEKEGTELKWIWSKKHKEK